MTQKQKWVVGATVATTLALFTGFQAAENATAAADPVVEGFRKATVASVSDAVGTVTGRNLTMKHDMRPRIGTKIVGRARTALVKLAPPSESTPASSTKDSVEMIDNAKPGEVGVIVMEDALDTAVIGGLMATAAKSRGMAGIVADGGVRDMEEMRGLGLTVFSRSISPVTAVGRYKAAGRDIPVTCGGVKVRPGDIVVGGEDGVVVIPREVEKDVLKLAQEIDDRESKMVPFIQKFRSLSKAIEVFNRI